MHTDPACRNWTEIRALALTSLVLCTPTPIVAEDGAILEDVREQYGFILAELAEDGFTPEHLLDLEDTTLTVTSEGNGGFDPRSGPLQWDADFGQRVDAGSDGLAPACTRVRVRFRRNLL